MVDLWNSNEDVIGSVANYFKKNGWKNNQLIMSNLIYKILIKNMWKMSPRKPINLKLLIRHL